MKRGRRIGIILVIALLLAGCASAPRYEVVRIVDGDTLIVRVEGKNERVRLRRLNAPELDEEGGQEAKEALERRFPAGSRVKIEIFARDKYGRIVAEITP